MPVTVTDAMPGVAEFVPVNVSVLDDVAGFWLNEAVSPVGMPEAVRFTFPLKPLLGLIVILLVILLP